MADTKLEYTLNLKDQFKKTMQGAYQDTAKLDSGMNKLEKTFQRVGRGMVAYFALSEIKNFATGVVMATAAMASFQNAVIASSRTEGEGRANLSFLNHEVDRLGLNLDAAQKGYKTFAGAVMGSNIQGAKSNKIFRQVSEAATVLGLSADQTEGSFLALGQMISKGTVQAEELRGQLAERIPGAFQIGARAMGMTSKQLGEAMKDGLIDSETFLVKFGDELERTFGGKLGAATNSLTSNLNRVGNEWQRLEVNIGESNTGIITSTLNMVSQVLKGFNQITSSRNGIDKAFDAAGIEKFNTIQRIGGFMARGIGATDSNVYNTEKLYDSIQGMFVKPSARSKSDALGSESGLLKLSSNYGKAFANKEIGLKEYQQAQALFKQALLEIKGNQTLNTLEKPKKDTRGSVTTSGSTSIGSRVDVSGPRAQNITINVNHLVETLNINNPSTAAAGAQDAKSQILKPLLELLNDANQIARA